MNLIYGYGSLIQKESRHSTVPSAEVAWPVEVPGWERLWNAQPETPGFSTTYLGIRKDAGSSSNGVMFLASNAELEALKARERNYGLVEADSASIKWLGEKPSSIPATFLVFTWEKDGEPTPALPLIQSYIDICLSGCLAVDRDLENTDWGFTRDFIRTTVGWSRHWVNDRIQPRAPHRHVKDAYLIDRLLFEERPDEFKAITIE